MKKTDSLTGIHHITAIAASPAENVHFYEEVLGLRLVKKTVNFDDPYTYHLYYGDSQGRPGTILTFFPWEKSRRGVAGAGMVTTTSFAILPGAVEFWRERLVKYGVTLESSQRFGEEVIGFTDPHGLKLELIAPPGKILDRDNSTHPNRIQGLHSATALVREPAETLQLLKEHLGFVEYAQEGNRIRLVLENKEEVARYYDLLVDPQAENGQPGSGTVHHIAFRTNLESDQPVWQQRLLSAGYPTSDIRDRNYFKSIYFNEPSGVLFEIATDGPGFAVDEHVSELGQALKLPAQYEHMREELENRLPSLSPDEFNYRYLDAGGDDSGTTLVALHGTGGDESDLLPLASQISSESAILSPRGKVVENGMARFFQRLAPNLFDDGEIRERADQLARFLNAKTNQYDRSAENIVALGYSNGANIAAVLLFTHPELFAGAILLRPMLVLQQNISADLTGKSVLVCRGLTDTIIPAHSTDLLIAKLKEAGAEVQILDVETGHQLTDVDVETAKSWFAAHFTPATSL